MNKRVLIIGVTLGCLLILVFSGILIYEQMLHEQEMFRGPDELSSYDPTDYANSAIGFFRINPETILSALDQGEEHIFTPVLREDASFADELTNLSISWTQADFLKIASALGELVWDDPMDLLNDWNIYYISFGGNCRDAPDGFTSAAITYFKTIEVNGTEVYTTRRIEIYPYGSMVRWGSGAIYSQPILHRWHSFDIMGDKVTADDTLHIADENGGKDVRLQVNNQCTIHVSSAIKSNEWHLSYSVSPSFSVFVDLDTGEYEFLGVDR